MAFGIKFTLTAPQQQSRIIAGFEVTDATLDFDRGELLIAYDLLNGSGQKLNNERTITVDGQAALDLFAQAQTVATNQNETVIRALYYVLTDAVRDALILDGNIEVA